MGGRPAAALWRRRRPRWPSRPCWSRRRIFPRFGRCAWRAGYCLLLRLVRPARGQWRRRAPGRRHRLPGLPRRGRAAPGAVLLGSAARGDAPGSLGRQPRRAAAGEDARKSKAAEKKAAPAPYRRLHPRRRASSAHAAANTICRSRSTTSCIAGPRPTAEKPQGWLIASAVYRAALAKEAMSQRLAVEELARPLSTCTFSAMRRGCGFPSAATRRTPARASLLDGRAVQPEWAGGRRRLARGYSRGRPVSAGAGAAAGGAGVGGGLGFDLAIPRLATVAIGVDAAGGAPPVEVPSALGPSARKSKPPRLVAELGPADRLTVRWQDAAGARAARRSTPRNCSG